MMKKCIFLCCLCWVMFGLSLAADSVTVRLYNVTAGVAVESGTEIFTSTNGTPILYRLEMSLENDFNLGSMSLGLRFSGDDGLMINWEPQVDGWGHDGQNTGFSAITVEPDCRYAAFADSGIGFQILEKDVDSIPADEILIGGWDIDTFLPPGPMEHMYNYYFTLTKDSLIEYCELTIDSAKVEPAGDFIFAAAVDGNTDVSIPGFSGPLNFTVTNSNGIILDADNNGSLPEVYYLKQNYPNPFNPTTTINYSLARKANVNLAVYNILGQQVKTLVNGEMSAGEYSVKWEGNDTNGDAVASGIYFYKMVSDDFVKTHKMVLMR